MALDAEIEMLKYDDPTFEAIKKYGEDSSDDDLSYTAEIMKVFKITRTKSASAKYPTTMTLIHGSRTTNWKGIIRTGLQQAPVTGNLIHDCMIKT
jgi:hypothetical protein